MRVIILAAGSGHRLADQNPDVLYHPAILQKLVETEIENCYLLDRDFEAVGFFRFGPDCAAAIAEECA